jgi:transcriptional regulator with XRE-family HTH domain
MNLAKSDPARGQRLQAARQAKKLTQQQAAQQLGCDVASVSRWEMGGVISPDHLKALCDLYGITAESVVFGLTP